MKSNIKYANILIIALAVAYFIIGGMNFLGYVGGKVILLCSIVSLAVAIVQIMDVVISALKMKTNLIAKKCQSLKSIKAIRKIYIKNMKI